MAKRSSNPTPRKPITTPGTTQGRTNSVAADPLDLSPWGPAGVQPSTAEQQLIQSLGPSANAVLQFEAAILQAITDGLDVTQAELGKVASDLQIAMSAGMLPAASAIAQSQTALSNTIRGALQQAAEFTSAGAQTPITLSAAEGYTSYATTHPSSPETPPVPAAPVPQVLPSFPPNVSPGTTGTPPSRPSYPIQPSPVSPITPTTPAPGSPGVPPVVPYPVPAVPRSPYPPLAAPGSQPGVYPGTTGAPGARPWDTASPTGPVAGVTAASAAVSTPTPTPAATTSGAPAGGANGGSSDCSPQPKAQTGPGLPPYAPSFGDKYLSDGEYTSWFDSSAPDLWTCRGVTFRLEVYTGSVGVNSPTPLPGTPGGPPLTPTTPSPTPPPVSPTTPTPTPTQPTQPTGPTLPPLGPLPPVSPTTPTPTPPPVLIPPTITTPPEPPIPPAPPIEPIPPEPPTTPYVPPVPTSPCPPGTDWVWDGQYYTCQPTPTPTQPTPTPTPEQPQPQPQSQPCSGDTPQDPCWRAANEVDEQLDQFHVHSAIAGAHQKKGSQEITSGIQAVAGFAVNVAMGDNLPGSDPCTIFYQMSLVDAGTGIADLLGKSVDWNSVLNQATQQGNWADKALKWAWTAPLFYIFDCVGRIWGAVVDKALGVMGGANQTLGVIAQNEFLFNLLNMFTLGALRKYKRVLTYANDVQYPLGIPSAELATAGYLGNEIDECTYRAYVCANDWRYDPYWSCARSQKFKFSAIELMTLYKRKGLDRNTLPQRLRELGSLHPEDEPELEALFHQIPTAGDLIRFMVRDVENTDVVQTFGMDDGFTDNYQGQVKEWAEMQGLDDPIMQRQWRAHWSIPSPTQLYEVLHRLRHDPNWGGEQKVNDDVVKALKQQDILPYWIPRLMAISYHPLTRTDLNRAYERGWIQDDDYVSGMYNNGYSDNDAQTLLKFAKNERNLAIRHADFTTTYSHGYIDEDTLRTWAQDEGYEGDTLDLAVEIGNEMLKIRTWEDETKAIARQFRACRINEDEAMQDAEALGIPNTVITRALGISKLNSTCGTRREMAAAVCQLLDQQLITPNDYVERMKVLKFDEVAIQHMLQLCVNATARRRAADAAKKAKEAQREAEKEQRAEEKAAKDAQRAAEKAAQLLAQQERRRQTRNEQLMRAANKLGQYLQGVSGPPNEYVDGLYHGLQTIKGLSQDEAARVLVVTSTAAKGMTMDEFTQWTYEAAQAALTDPYQLFGSVPIA